MITAILAGQAVLLNPVLRAPSAITAGAGAFTGVSTSAAVIICLGTAADVSATQSTITNADLVNISGKGVVLFCAFISGTSSGSCVGTITIDGVIVYNAGSSGANKAKAPIGCISAIDPVNSFSTISFEAVPFYSSLRIQYRSDTAAIIVGAAAKYRLSN